MRCPWLATAQAALALALWGRCPDTPPTLGQLSPTQPLLLELQIQRRKKRMMGSCTEEHKEKHEKREKDRERHRHQDSERMVSSVRRKKDS